jgi:hypothetical protein
MEKSHSSICSLNLVNSLPIAWTKDIDQFVDELPPGEKIYTFVQKDTRYTNVVEKIYIAGIENRALLQGYKDVYVGSAYYNVHTL